MSAPRRPEREELRMETRRKRYGWIVLGGLLCLFALVFAFKVRDSNRAFGQAAPPPPPPEAEGAKEAKVDAPPPPPAEKAPAPPPDKPQPKAPSAPAPEAPPAPSAGPGDAP